MMVTWFIVLVTVTIAILLCLCSLLNSKFSHSRSSTKLPPGPPSIPIIRNIQCLCRSPLQTEFLLRTFIAKYGPIMTFPIGTRPTIFIADRSIAHKALVLNGTLFADRPPALPVSKIISSNQHSINTASYDPLWRLLRRNLTSQILHPSRVKSYGPARKWVLDILLNRFRSHSESGNPVCVVDHFQYAMFCLLVLMCFGEKLDESQIKEIENMQRTMLMNLGRFNVLNFWPKLTKIFLRKRWENVLELKRNQDEVLIPFIEARRKAKQSRANREEGQEEDEKFVMSYVDTLLDLELPEENRKFTDEEISTITSEFLTGGTDTTTTALQWIMANLVKYPEIQNQLYAKIKGVMGDGLGEEVKEEELGKVAYLKAVVLEGLRRHPPGHFLLPHAVKEDTTLENYLIPKNGTVNFMVAEMGWDPEVWEDPMEFKPERFMKGGKEGEEVAFDITESKEIKMMPFGAGRRVCPGASLAILHLEYFIANLVWRFEWKALDGDDVDMSEGKKVDFTVVMKKPLKANIISRF